VGGAELEVLALVGLVVGGAELEVLSLVDAGGRRAVDVGPPWYWWRMSYLPVAMPETPLLIGDDVAISGDVGIGIDAEPRDHIRRPDAMWIGGSGAVTIGALAGRRLDRRKRRKPWCTAAALPSLRIGLELVADDATTGSPP